MHQIQNSGWFGVKKEDNEVVATQVTFNVSVIHSAFLKFWNKFDKILNWVSNI